MNQVDPPRSNVLGISVNSVPLGRHVELILSWAMQNMSRTVLVANVHMLMEAHWNRDFRQLLHSVDLVVPDGRPLMCMLRLLGNKNQEQIDGINLLQTLCQESQQNDVGIFFLGSGNHILGKMRKRLAIEYPRLNIIEMTPLPFRALTSSEDRALIQRINQSKTGLLLLSLGCPKQERWLAVHRGKINATMVGLGGVFPVYAGLQTYTPEWTKKFGLEWAYHLCQIPRKIWRRYATTMPAFLWLVAQKLVNQPKKH